jgi:hypothetical protein
MRNPIALGCATICAAILLFPQQLLAETAAGTAHTVELEGAKVHYTE